jgi:selenide,water dikinase
LPDSRPKSGVFAVRAGPPLSRNLRLALLEQNLKKFSPQRAFLSLISTGDRCAVASRGSWSVRGKWVWRWKEWIDRNWMQKYQQLPPVEMQPASDAASTRDADASVPNEMRCGGCGAKIGSTVLTRVLRRLEPVSRGDVMIDLKSPDDAATSRVPSDRVVVQTVDFFRSFVSDPFVFGKIAANHALGDIYAMGAEPQLALAIAVVPIGAEAKVEEQLFQMLAGATTILNAHGTTLAGGHSAEGLELALGLSVQGMADPSRLLRKGGLKAGDALILTKPLGTGTLFAAAMRRRAEARWIETAIASMLVSNRAAADCFLRHEATACTDITGFGLLGHLLEMATASVVRVEIELARLPILPGATATLAAGIESSLQPENLQLDRFIENRDAAAKQKMFEILFDPQTAGGLLASVPGDEADACVAALVERGYAAAAIIGRVMGSEKSATPIIIR